MRSSFLKSTAAVLLYVSCSIAQAQAPVEQEAPVSKTINLTLEHRHVVKEIVKDMKMDRVPADTPVAVSEKVPASIQLQAVPAEVGAKVSQIKNHMFFLQGDRVVIVDPKDNKVVDIID
jgi:hypothetical protein